MSTDPRHYDVILGPIVTEKATTASEQNKVVFKVRKDATKPQIKEAIEAIYNKIRPLVFYVGAAGMVPDTLGAKVQTPDEFVVSHPDAKLSKAEKEEGSFFTLPDQTVLTIYVKGEYFTTSPAV
jgi:large subunit ribosomal protein L23